MGCGASTEKGALSIGTTDSTSTTNGSQNEQNNSQTTDPFKLNIPEIKISPDKTKSQSARGSGTTTTSNKVKRVRSESYVVAPPPEFSSVAMSNITKKLVKGAEGETPPQVSVTHSEAIEPEKNPENGVAKENSTDSSSQNEAKLDTNEPNLSSVENQSSSYFLNLPPIRYVKSISIIVSLILQVRLKKFLLR